MLKLLVMIISAVLVTACGMPNTKVGDGRDWVQVSCNGFSDWTKCKEKASKLCPNGYDFADQKESLISQNRSMMIACKK